MKFYNRKNQGITLVALIITIIILLILAGISIAQLSGNGLFYNVQLAKERQENAQILENEILKDYENKLNYMNNNKLNSEENKKEPTKLIERMSSNTSIVGNCYYKNGNYASNPAYYSFDEDSSTYSTSPSTYMQEDYLQYDFNDYVKIEKIELQFSMSAHIFSSCKVTASADGENWDTIIETDQFNENILDYILDVKEEYKNKQYKKVRIWQIGTRLGAGDNRMCINQIQMYNSI